MTTEGLEGSANEQNIDNSGQNIDNNDQNIDNKGQGSGEQQIDLSKYSDAEREAIINKAIEDGKVVGYERFKGIYGNMKAYEREVNTFKRSSGSGQGQDANKGTVDGEKELVKPKPEDFSSYELYLDARSDYDREVIKRDVAKTRSASEVEAQRQQEESEKAEYWDNAQTEAETKDPKFKEKVMSGQIYIPEHPVIIDLLTGTKYLSEFGVYFAQNPAEVGKIIRLPIVQAAREIARLETTFQGPPQKKDTGAPENTNKNSGGKTVLTKDRDKMDMDEYEATRIAEGYKP